MQKKHVVNVKWTKTWWITGWSRIHANWVDIPCASQRIFLFSGINIQILGAGSDEVGLWGSPPWAETRSVEVLMKMMKIPRRKKSAKLHLIIPRLVPNRKFAPWSITSERGSWVWDRSFQVAQRGDNGHRQRKDSILPVQASVFSTAKYNHHSSWSNLPASLTFSHTFPADTGARYYKLQEH